MEVASGSNSGNSGSTLESGHSAHTALWYRCIILMLLLCSNTISKCKYLTLILSCFDAGTNIAQFIVT